MPDPVSKAQQYRERAMECLRLASLADSAAVRAEYKELAKHYQELLRAELSFAGAEQRAL
jgi:hypothetical protein